jgi:hypothetical protein
MSLIFQNQRKKLSESSSKMKFAMETANGTSMLPKFENLPTLSGSDSLPRPSRKHRDQHLQLPELGKPMTQHYIFKIHEFLGTGKTAIPRAKTFPSP